ncbi:hypothetical protein CVT26_015794, partial [Gymnopilus dilepis]
MDTSGVTLNSDSDVGEGLCPDSVTDIKPAPCTTSAQHDLNGKEPDLGLSRLTLESESSSAGFQTIDPDKPTLNHDVLHLILSEILPNPNRRERQAALKNLSLASKTLNDAVRPLLFESVRWPQGDKWRWEKVAEDRRAGRVVRVKEEKMLAFFPEEVWGYIKTLHLDWPDHWPETSPPTFGTTLQEYGPSTYTPSPHAFELLSHTLPLLPSLRTFTITCPFNPPASLLRLITCLPELKEVQITDTPINAGISTKGLPAAWKGLERVVFVPVGEAIRVGEGPFEAKYHDLAYWSREYRKRHRMTNDTAGGGGFYARSLFHTLCVARPERLRYLQISGAYVSLYDFTQVGAWPVLETLILTGHEPIWSGAFLVEALQRMPALRDLRVLLSKAMGGPGGVGSAEKFDFLKSWHGDEEVRRATFQNLRALAVSQICDLSYTFQYTPSLEKLAFLALINHPRLPIALRRWEVVKLLEDLENWGGGGSVRQVRIVLEDGVDVEFVGLLGRVCPRLEVVEVEVCGYREGDAGFEWTDYGDAFSTYTHLRSLRIGIPFEAHDPDGIAEHKHIDAATFLRADRRDCGTYIASRVPSLRRIGFEYRMKMGSHRYEDR